jgi:hypothetical protein
MKRLALVALTVAVSLACSSSPTGPSSGSDEFVNGTIDGQPFRATVISAMVGRFDGRETLSVVALEGCAASSWGIQLALERVPARQPLVPATYSSLVSRAVGIGPGVSTTERELTASVYRSDNYWDAPGFPTGGPGTVTLTSITASHAEGSFSLQPMARANNSLGGTRNVEGTFRVRISDRRIC